MDRQTDRQTSFVVEVERWIAGVSWRRLTQLISVSSGRSYGCSAVQVRQTTLQ